MASKPILKLVMASSLEQDTLWTISNIEDRLIGTNAIAKWKVRSCKNRASDGIGQWSWVKTYRSHYAGIRILCCLASSASSSSLTCKQQRQLMTHSISAQSIFWQNACKQDLDFSLKRHLSSKQHALLCRLFAPVNWPGVHLQTCKATVSQLESTKRKPSTMGIAACCLVRRHAAQESLCQRQQHTCPRSLKLRMFMVWPKSRDMRCPKPGAPTNARLRSLVTSQHDKKMKQHM